MYRHKLRKRQQVGSTKTYCDDVEEVVITKRV